MVPRRADPRNASGPHLNLQCGKKGRDTVSKPTDPLSALPWRVGRKLGRTIYAMVGAEPCDDDVLIGMMDTAELAGEACVAHNHRRTRGRGTIGA